MLSLTQLARAQNKENRAPAFSLTAGKEDSEGGMFALVRSIELQLTRIPSVRSRFKVDHQTSRSEAFQGSFRPRQSNL